MSRRLASVFVLCCAFLTWRTRATAQAPTDRTIRIAAVAGQPARILHIAATEAKGLVEVRDATGALVQNLTCALLRDNPAPSEQELRAVREQFVSRFAAADLDFDGFDDLMGPREFGAKWAVNCVWLFDPRNHIFVKGFLAGQLELLNNLTADAKRGRIAAYFIGPGRPGRDVYRISEQDQNRPGWRQLIPEASCFVDTGINGDSRETIVVTNYEHGQATVERRAGRARDTATGLRGCDEF